MQCATPKRVQPLHITASSPQEGSVELHAIRRKHLVIDYRARALVGVELDVATNKVVLRLEGLACPVSAPGYRAPRP